MSLQLRLSARRLQAFHRDAYARFLADYERYARMRGFRSLNDWPYHRRGFIECWAEPGFHRFWQVWNPGIAYFVWRLYLRLGGRRRWVFPTLAAFILCGVAHHLVALLLLGRWSYTIITAFTAFGLFTVISRLLARRLRQRRWPLFLNVLVNAGLVVGSMDLGFRVDRLLH